MKCLIFLLCLCVAITTIVETRSTNRNYYSWIDGASELIANEFDLATADAKACFVEKNITLEDITVVPQILLNNGDTSNVQESALRLGCLFACVFKKKEWMDGTTLNVQELKRDLSPTHFNPERYNEILDTCTDQVKDMTNECKVMFNLLKCMGEENTRFPG